MKEKNELPSSIGCFQFFGIVIAQLGLVASGFLVFALLQLPKDASPFPLIIQSICTVLASITWWAFVNVITYIAKNIANKVPTQPTT